MQWDVTGMHWDRLEWNDMLWNSTEAYWDGTGLCWDALEWHREALGWHQDEMRHQDIVDWAALEWHWNTLGLH